MSAQTCSTASELYESRQSSALGDLADCFGRPENRDNLGVTAGLPDGHVWAFDPAHGCPHEPVLNVTFWTRFPTGSWQALKMPTPSGSIGEGYIASATSKSATSFGER